MQTLTQQLVERGLADRVLSDGQLRRLLDGSDQRRHHLVNRAMAAGELIRLRRGRYLLARRLRSRPAHPFALAQAFDAGSYVSFETALAYHGWIPEAVASVASVSPGRKSLEYQHEVFGSFSFHPLALKSGGLLVLIERLVLDEQVALVASPLRALMDLVCLRKQEWQGIDWLIDGMRIDQSQLRTITGAQNRALLDVYSQRRTQVFLSALAKELGND
ncbi:MAG: type IV toxin-antitoxin system AbiEi family antitoxin domain-containing protein [Pseudomarimonas sp.]